jgi:DNA polymerase-1
MKMSEDFLRYAALDAACTREIHDAFWKDLGQFQTAVDLTMRLFPVLMFMQTRGIKVNKEALASTRVDVQADIKAKQEELDLLCGRPLNVNSSQDCQRYFYNELGIKPYTNKDGNPTVDDKALQRLVRGVSGRPGLRQAKLVQEIRGLQKLYGTYLNLSFDADDRIRCSFNPRGTKFGRLSSSKTIFGTGTNFQNLPQDFKKFLVADEGYVFVEVDKRQAEWVVVAYATGDANMIAAVEKGIDVHTHTASLMFHVDPALIKQESKIVGHNTDADYIRELRQQQLSEFYDARWPRTMSLRQCGKKSNHGLNYDEGPNGFALINEIEIPEAKRIVALYHQIYPGIRLWYESIKRELARDRTLTNCFGRTVRFMGQWGDDLWKSAYAMIPQSTVVDSLNDGMVKIHADDELCSPRGFNIDVLAQVHDSVLMQVPLSFIKQEKNFNLIRDKIVDYTSPDITYNARTFKIASDFKFGLNWGEAHPERNPTGMVEVETYEDFMTALEGWQNNERTQRLA